MSCLYGGILAFHHIIPSTIDNTDKNLQEPDNFFFLDLPNSYCLKIRNRLGTMWLFVEDEQDA